MINVKFTAPSNHRKQGKDNMEWHEMEIYADYHVM